MKKFIIVTTAFVFLASLYFFWPGAEVKIDIPEGSSASQVARQLKERGIILSPTWFKIVVRITGTARKIKPGEYVLKKNMSAEEALMRLVAGSRDYIKILIPEGWRMEQIAERLEANGVTSGKEFTKLVMKDRLEGRLFPTTYHLEKGMDPARVTALMTGEFDRQVKPMLDAELPPGLTPDKVLILASIVEREAVVVTEKPLIAAVYLNRVRRKMPLEADPTVQYALGYWKKGLTFKDLKIKSPYNTYAHPGLPPGPICNPGYDSVHAVLNPAKIDALYFVADRKGKHIFNTSFSEHKKAKRRVEDEAKVKK
ncbi:MAG: endolytic transglycosylase MltG [bacterium]